MSPRRQSRQWSHAMNAWSIALCSIMHFRNIKLHTARPPYNSSFAVTVYPCYFPHEWFYGLLASFSATEHVKTCSDTVNQPSVRNACLSLKYCAWERFALVAKRQYIWEQSKAICKDKQKRALLLEFSLRRPLWWGLEAMASHLVMPYHCLEHKQAWKKAMAI